MAGASARVLNRSVVAFGAPGWTPPAVVLVDTNVAAEALLKGAAEHVSCVALFQRLRDEGTTVVFNRLMEIEFVGDGLQRRSAPTLPRKQLRHVRFSDDGRLRAASALDDARARWERMIARINWLRVELHEIADAVPDLMRSYGLQSYDAVHAATLSASGITDFVTRDIDFARLLPEDATLPTTAARVKATLGRRRTAAPC
jgi:predicted nucleic acid-binding protein